ncbi:MAG TPA: serine/threonine-protein kinase, partial [Polyangiaceae bacterium]|nr:serine/threonine-protein kinase [Polyangiaceae bacterium]
MHPLVTEHGHVAAGIQPGQILLGKYRIERVLGVGGMGVVVAATHVNLEERVAIKFLLPEALQNAEAVARFLREARAAVRIKSEHVARVTDVGTLETGAPYMIMEYLDGGDLGSVAKTHGALPIEQAVEYVLQACEALAEAHSLGIIHRDLKPSNLFVVTRADGTPSVKVLDFGISKVTGMGASGADLGMTKTSTIMGSPLYMSPEQMASSKDVDARTDIWALGAILFELLTGRVPFQADTITQLCVMILQQRAEPLRNLRPDAPEALQNVIACCLEKDRNQRYANIADFANSLAPFAPRRARLSIERVSRVLRASGHLVSPPGIHELAPSSQGMPQSTSAPWAQTGNVKKGGGLKVGLILGGLVIAGAAVAAIASTKRGSTTPEPSAAVPLPTTPEVKAAVAPPLAPTPVETPPTIAPALSSAVPATVA